MKKLTLSLLALLAACGDASKENPRDASALLPDAASSAPDAPLPDTKPPTAGCDYVATLCAKLEECAPFFLAAGYGDRAGCIDRTGKACVEQSKSKGSGLGQATIAACAAALTTASCDQVLANAVSACAFRGALADGAVCGDNSQCASGFCSHSGNLCGVCAARGAAGAACPAGSNDECQTGLVCSSGKLCAVPAALGAACDDATAPCLMGSFCTTAKTCAATVAAGQECPGAYLNFRDGTLCLGKSTAANPVLASQIGTAAVGQVCGLAPGNGAPPTLCAPGSVAACSPAKDSIDLLGMPTKGLCAAPVEDGSTCAVSSACMAGALCISGTCRIPSGRYCDEPVDAS